MKSNKRYTNQTFTKRVDHDGGLHRPHRKMEEPAYCEKCGAEYEHDHWFFRDPDEQGAFNKHWQAAMPTMCPACRQIAGDIVGGYVYVDGKFLTEHRMDIENLLENEAARALEDNPLSRIMHQRNIDDKILIETTTEHLAQRLGHALQKAFDGHVSYAFSDENKMTRVRWHRD